MRGAKNLSSKLTDELVRDIRIEHAIGDVSYTTLGKKYGVTPVTIRDAINRKTWKHVV